ncbi:MAG: zinc ribbon domain-containing protein, partial [Pyrinomonadaceae bacterium]
MNTQLETRCLACGVLSVREARFCRQCGTSLRVDELASSTELVSPDAVTVDLTAHQRSTEQFRLPTAPVAVAETRIESADLDRHLANVYRAQVIERAQHKRRMAVALLLAAVSIVG